jgi:hypothetical protein
MMANFTVESRRVEGAVQRYERKRLAFFLVAAIIGVALRFAIASHGYNYDMGSHRIIADMVADGKSVYTTQRYNYGPVWFHVLHYLDMLPSPSSDPLWALRWKIVAFLTGVDLIISYLLLRWHGALPATLFFLNPISIIITGYHSQFDNFAILVAILAARLIGDREATSDVRKVFGFVLLGLSLMIKHIAFIFPIWLFFGFESRKLKILAVLVPYGLFLLSFVPYLESWSGIVHHVFLYHSIPNGPFWKEIAPGFVANKLALPIFFLAAMFLIGLYWRKRNAPEALWLYLTSLVVFSSAIANQYLAIPVPAISVNWNPFYGIYTLFATFFLAGSHDGLALPWLASVYPDGGINSLGYGVNKFLGYREVIVALFLGLVYQEMTKDQRASVFNKLRDYALWVRAQLVQQWKEIWTR